MRGADLQVNGDGIKLLSCVALVWPPIRHWPFSLELSTGTIPLRVIQYEVLQKTPPPFIYFFSDEAF